jgi:peptide/nickel transport system substrate-binding protein
VETLRRNPNMQVYTREKGTSWEYIEFNASKPPFNDKALRRAVGYALKPDEILAASYIYADPIKSPLPIGTPGYDAEVGEQYGFTHDLEKARALLGEAGYAPGAGAVVAKGGTPLQITLTTWNAPQATRAAQVVQSQLKAIGIEARLETMDAGAFLAKLREGDFELAFNRTTWPDPIILSNTFKSPGRDKQYSNPELDTVLEQIEVTVDPAQRQEAVKTAQRMLLEDAAVVPLFADQFMMAGRKEVRDFRFSALGLPMYQDVWLARS